MPCVQAILIQAWIAENLRKAIFVTLRSKALLERLIVSQLVKKSLTLYGTWKFITVLTKALELSQS
jgi:hypothetical protein